MPPMFEANIIVKLTTESGIECVGGVLIPTEHHYDHSVLRPVEIYFLKFWEKIYNKDLSLLNLC